MSKFRVQTTINVWVEAESQAEAKDKAIGIEKCAAVEASYLEVVGVVRIESIMTYAMITG